MDNQTGTVFQFGSRSIVRARPTHCWQIYPISKSCDCFAMADFGMIFCRRRCLTSWKLPSLSNVQPIVPQSEMDPTRVESKLPTPSCTYTERHPLRSSPPKPPTVCTSSGPFRPGFHVFVAEERVESVGLGLGSIVYNGDQRIRIAFVAELLLGKERVPTRHVEWRKERRETLRRKCPKGLRLQRVPKESSKERPRQNPRWPRSRSRQKRRSPRRRGRSRPLRGSGLAQKHRRLQLIQR